MANDDKLEEAPAKDLLNLHLQIINSERTVIWQRYSALLIANTVLSGLSGFGKIPLWVIAIIGFFFIIVLVHYYPKWLSTFYISTRNRR